MTSKEQGSLITICTAINAAGTSIPPLMIFPCVNYKNHFVYGVPPGGTGASYQSVWMTEANFFLYFVKHTRGWKDRIFIFDRQSWITYQLKLVIMQRKMALWCYPSLHIAPINYRTCPTLCSNMPLHGTCWISLSIVKLPYIIFLHYDFFFFSKLF